MCGAVALPLRPLHPNLNGRNPSQLPDVAEDRYLIESPGCGPAAAAIGMVGALEVQTFGQGEFVSAHAELVGDELRFEVYDIDGQVVVRTARVLGAAVRDPRNKRRGRAGAFRLDLLEPDTSGCRKFILHAATAQLLGAWRGALERHSRGEGGTVAGSTTT